jgi:hypothetical protein
MMLPSFHLYVVSMKSMNRSPVYYDIVEITRKISSLCDNHIKRSNRAMVHFALVGFAIAVAA